MKRDFAVQTKPFCGLSLFSGSQLQLRNILLRKLEEKKEVRDDICFVATPNPEQFVLAWKDASFFHALKEADLLLPDGAGLVWAVNRSLPKQEKMIRLAGRRVFHDLLVLAKERSQKVFLLGGKKGSAAAIITQYAATWHYDDGPKERTAQILAQIQSYRPTILAVAYGAPYQEQWIVQNRSALAQAGVRIAMVVGGSFEYEAGFVPAVPSWVENMHLEWLQRLITEPWRLKRQLLGAEFFVRVLFSSTK